jgi:Cu/Zn superoxide dismutase
MHVEVVLPSTDDDQPTTILKIIDPRTIVSISSILLLLFTKPLIYSCRIIPEIKREYFVLKMSESTTTTTTTAAQAEPVVTTTTTTTDATTTTTTATTAAAQPSDGKHTHIHKNENTECSFFQRRNIRFFLFHSN